MPNRKPKNSPDSAATHPPSEQLEMRIPARAEWVRVVRLATAGVAGRAGFAYDDIEDIKLAVTEACNNAILHSIGKRDDLAQIAQNDGASAATIPYVTVRWRIVENGVRISVSDEGRLYSNPSAMQSGSTPELPPDELPESGMGLLLIESLMDEVEHEFGAQTDTVIHMTKRVPTPGKTVAAGDAPISAASSPPDPDSPVQLGSSRPARARRAATPPSSR